MAGFTTRDDGPRIAGLRAGSGPRVLLLHGGPALGFGYLRDLADEIAQENDVAWYQQRGLAPSAAEGPYTLEAGLSGIQLPVGFVHGSRSPMPVASSTDAADRIPGAWVDLVEGAGHFVWVEAPGAVRTSLRRLTES